MESKITVDVDTSGQSQLRIDYILSDDLRDKLIGRFLNQMGIPGERNGFWAYCRLGHETKSKKGGTYDSAVVFVEPMDLHVLGLHFPEIQNLLERENKRPTPPDEPNKI